MHWKRLRKPHLINDGTSAVPSQLEPFLYYPLLNFISLSLSYGEFPQKLRPATENEFSRNRYSRALDTSEDNLPLLLLSLGF